MAPFPYRVTIASPQVRTGAQAGWDPCASRGFLTGGKGSMEICPRTYTVDFPAGEIVLLCARVTKRKGMRENTEGKGVIFLVERKNISMISKMIFF